MKKAIIFDLDGTLWDSSAQVIESWNEVLEKYPQYNVKVRKEEMHRYMGRTLYDISELMFPDIAKEEAHRIIDECCENENEYLKKNGGVLFPGVEETLEKLCKDYSLYIVSNCQCGYIEIFLEYFGFGKYFSDYECQANTGKLKWENIRIIIERNHVDMAFYVGDTKLDMESCRLAEVPFVHAAYGFGRFECEDIKLNVFSDVIDAAKQIFNEAV